MNGQLHKLHFAISELLPYGTEVSVMVTANDYDNTYTESYSVLVKLPGCEWTHACHKIDHADKALKCAAEYARIIQRTTASVNSSAIPAAS